MSSLDQLIETRTVLDQSDMVRLHQLLESWQLIADLSFADLRLWCPMGPGEGFVCAAQMRPHTAQTLHPEDSFGEIVRPEEFPAVDRAYSEGQSWQQDEPLLIDGVQVRMEAIPVPHGGRIIAVMSKEGAPLTHRRPGRLEETYLDCATLLSAMVEHGTFPYLSGDYDSGGTARVGDGLVRLDPHGRVLYASPNAVSAYRRLGVLESVIGDNIQDLAIDPEPALHALSSGVPAEWEVGSAGIVVLQWALPLFSPPASAVEGALLLLRDVTELRDREKLLRHKDAHIKEIHHRVKNNLQTIASLLRIQARRLGGDAKRELEDSVQRIGAIAIVHEKLATRASESVDFGGVLKDLIEMVSGGLIHPEDPVEIEVVGSSGSLPSELATPLAVVLVELVQNAVDHAFEKGGKVTVELSRQDGRVQVVVADNGVGLPDGFGIEDGGLGFGIVKSLVIDQLGGSIELASPRGARVTLSLPVESPSGSDS